MIILLQRILFLNFFACESCFGLFTKIIKESGNSFWCTLSAWFFHKNVPYLILYRWTKFQCHRPVNGVRSHLHTPTHTSIYLGMLLLHVRNFIWPVNSMSTLQQVCSVILLQIIHLQLHVKLSFAISMSLFLTMLFLANAN